MSTRRGRDALSQAPHASRHVILRLTITDVGNWPFTVGIQSSGRARAASVYTNGVLADAPVQKDVVIAGIGIGAALGGFVLVFLGVILGTISSFTGDTPAAVLQKYDVASKVTLAVFLLSLLSVLVGFVWLLSGGGDSFYRLTVTLFMLSFAVIAGAAVWVTVTLLRG